MISELQKWLMMFYTGVTRRAGSVLEQQSAAMEDDRPRQDIVKTMVLLAQQLRDELQRNRLESFGAVLHENWLLKKRLADGISSPEIDAFYDAACRAGALGGKLLGAGAGGFLVFCVPPYRQKGVREALSELRQIPFQFERLGSRIILYQP